MSGCVTLIAPATSLSLCRHYFTWTHIRYLALILGPTLINQNAICTMYSKCSHWSRGFFFVFFVEKVFRIQNNIDIQLSPIHYLMYWNTISPVDQVLFRGEARVRGNYIHCSFHQNIVQLCRGLQRPQRIIDYNLTLNDVFKWQ